MTPALLVSYVYLEPFLQEKTHYSIRSWALDSGAYSVNNSGQAVDLDRYIETCKELLGQDNQLAEVFALDVIGDHGKSMANVERTDQKERFRQALGGQE